MMVQLNHLETWMAMSIGKARRENRELLGMTDLFHGDSGKNSELDMFAAAAEIAVAKTLGVYPPTDGEASAYDLMHQGRPIEVKAMRRAQVRDLLAPCHTVDRNPDPGRLFVLALWPGPGSFNLVGWCSEAELKEGGVRNLSTGKHYSRPVKDLKTMEALINWLNH